jgi:SagB-type dehydrogenase family enzyme
LGTLALVLPLIAVQVTGDAMEPAMDTARVAEVLKLPRPRLQSATSVEEALGSRRSVRNYRHTPLSREEAGQLLWAAQGITSPAGHRTAPSAGALYPLTLYLVAGEVTGVPAGVYRYDPRQHGLIRTLAGDLRGVLCAAALGQGAITGAPATLVIAAQPERTTGKYGQRGIRYLHMDAGHAAENVYLQAVSLGLGTVAIGAFDDAGVQRVLHLPGGMEPLYLMPVGRPSGQ